LSLPLLLNNANNDQTQDEGMDMAKQLDCLWPWGGSQEQVSFD
jgi:hypothetical protein